MKLKKAVKVLLSCMLAGALFTGCGGGDSSDKSPSSEVKLGMISHLSVNEKQMEDILQKAQDETKVQVVRYVPTYYDSLTLMQMGIESGSVDQISLYSNVANYVVANNDKYELVGDDMTLKILSDNFCFAVRKDDAALKADLDKVIGEMKDDGSLDKLVKDYITDADKGAAPPAIEIPMTEGADTIKVGVTGDLPPLDYVSADGKAAGFNTALLAEVAKRSGKNIEVVDIDSGARSAALTSKQIDVVFWAVVPNGEKMPKDIDKPEGLNLSEPYFQDNVEHLKLKK